LTSECTIARAVHSCAVRIKAPCCLCVRFERLLNSPAASISKGRAKKRGRQRRLEDLRLSKWRPAAFRVWCEARIEVTEETSSIDATGVSEGGTMTPRLSWAFVSHPANFAVCTRARNRSCPKFHQIVRNRIHGGLIFFVNFVFFVVRVFSCSHVPKHRRCSNETFYHEEHEVNEGSDNVNLDY